MKIPKVPTVEVSGLVYYLEVSGLVYYLEVSGLVYYLAVSGLVYYLEVSGLVYYLEVSGLVYYLAVSGLVYYLAVSGLVYYLEVSGLVYYLAVSGLVYYLAVSGLVYYLAVSGLVYYLAVSGLVYYIAVSGLVYYLAVSGLVYYLAVSGLVYYLAVSGLVYYLAVSVLVYYLEVSGLVYYLAVSGLVYYLAVSGLVYYLAVSGLVYYIAVSGLVYYLEVSGLVYYLAVSGLVYYLEVSGLVYYLAVIGLVYYLAVSGLVYYIAVSGLVYYLAVSGLVYYLEKTGPNTVEASMSYSDPFQDLVDALRQTLTVHSAPTPAPPTITSANTTSPLLYASPMAKPAPYSGSAEDCNGFLLQCSLVLEMQPHMFPTERSKVAFLITQLSGKALLWADSIWSQNHPAVQSYFSFVDQFKEVFGKPSWDSSIGEELYNLKQGKMSVNEYALQFRTLAAKSGWNEQALLTSYRQGLDPQLRLHLAAYEDSIRLERFIQLYIHFATRMQSCLEEHQGQVQLTTILCRPGSVSPPEPAHEPMQLESSRLTPAERQRRLTQNLCLYCGAPGHVISACPIRPPRPMVSAIFPSIQKMKPLTTIGKLTAADVSIPVAALLDSGSAGNFISSALYRQLKLKTTATSTTYQIQSITGKPVSRRQVSQCVGPLLLQIGVLHLEKISLLVLEESTADMILGRPWLEQHNPILSWKTGEVLKWGDTCFNDWFSEFPVPRSPSSNHLPVCATSIESPLEKRSVDIPACYAPFSDIFCPKRASKLPPHRPWDCAIDLLPGESVPRGKIYPLSVPEEKAMEEYIEEALAQGYIHPSTSPAASSFFFVAKKDGGLRPCIDYRALNYITVKFRYPLPLVQAALEHLRGATVFTKLDLRSAYNLIRIRIREGDEWKTTFIMPTGHYEYLVMPYGLVNVPSVFQDFIHKVLREFLHKFVLVYIDDILIYSRSLAKHRHHIAEVLKCLREFQLFLKAKKCSFHQPSVQFLGYNIDSSGIQMDEGKVTAIKDWPTPTTVKELQRFLGFANFYRRFIQNYSSISNPLTSLLRNKPKSLSWTTSAEEAFNALKEAFTTAPLLVHPDPNKLFIVEVDASTTGVGAVLSQQQGNPSPLHPCAFFSRKLNPVEVNYDIGNRELLAVKLALEEWRHWLEGARHPFLVLTGHKNLEYLRAAKRLNPRQARWALFFTRFNFTISYRPGSKNTKADALSRLFTPEENTEEPETILPEKVIVSPITWSEKTLPSTNASTNTPPGCPPGLQYITRAWRTPLIHSAHTSLGTGHPGVNETLLLLKDRFWWPNMAADVRRYVQGCRDCAISKSPRHRPSGKLLPLPIPNRPWSHLGVDFITNLPASNDCTCIFVVVDRFSKSCRLIPLKGLPTAMETAELMFNHIFHYFGIPEDIVSDREP
ncbi:hypothetical protein QTP70_009845 [Hemibagrus guttatus]|uniref:Gypsy retrotransposon integrase-like protein 1 n=1 Tax=Hemibagrus guttatus TaxID=175788 RepID=A0AAE0Q3K3_9TELE|nr:hypothetical protein QTP70_009845 [Hemibagrus guttatus]